MGFSYLKIIFRTFYSADVYIDAYRRSSGFGLKYLFIITVLSSALVSISWLWYLSNINPEKIARGVGEFVLSEQSLSFEDNINRVIDLLQQVPEISIKNGSVIVQEQQPYIITDITSGNDFAILDTTGKYKTLNGTNAILLLTDTKLIMKDENGKEKVTYIHDIVKSSNFDESNINKVLYIISQIPSFSLQDGKLVTSMDKTYTIFDKENRKLIDIGPEASSIEGTDLIASVTSNEIIYKTIFSKKVDSIKLSELDEQKFYDLLSSLAQVIRSLMLWIVPIFALPFIILTSFAVNIAVLGCYAFIGYVYIKVAGLGSFSYKEIMRVAALAITPMILVSAALPKILHSQGTVYFIISIGYLYFALKSITAR